MAINIHKKYFIYLRRNVHMKTKNEDLGMAEQNKTQEKELKNKITNVLSKTNTKFLIHNLEKRILLLGLTDK